MPGAQFKTCRRAMHFQLSSFFWRDNEQSTVMFFIMTFTHLTNHKVKL